MSTQRGGWGGATPSFDWDDVNSGGVAVAESNVQGEPLWNAVDASTEKRFSELAAQWKREVGHISSITRRISHPAYLQIISLGASVVPLLLSELEREPNHWFQALRTLTGADPVTPEQRGKVEEMANAWLSWGRIQGYLQ